MTEGALAQALGDLQGTVRGLQQTVQSMASQWRRQEEAATAGRRALHERVEAFSVQLTGALVTLENLKADVEGIKRDIETEIDPVVTAYKIAMAHRAGMFFAGKLFWAGVLAIATVIGFSIHEAFQYAARSGHLPFMH